jgi:hypothetical protein
LILLLPDQPDYRQLLTTPTGLQKVTEWVIDRWILGQYQKGQGLPLPTGAFIPSQQLSMTMILVQQDTATYEGDRWTSMRRKVLFR